MTQPPHLFSPLTLRGVTVSNRIVISPMQQYSAGPATQLIHAGRKASVSRPWQGYSPLDSATARALGRDQRFERWPPSWGWWLEKRARAGALAETSTNATGG